MRRIARSGLRMSCSDSLYHGLRVRRVALSISPLHQFAKLSLKEHLGLYQDLYFSRHELHSVSLDGLHY
jgi:hypothetical protein